MKRVFTFLPAVLAGLLGGWLISKWIKPHAPEEKTASSGSAAKSAATRGAGSSGDSDGWAKMMEARSLLPIPVDNGHNVGGVFTIGTIKGDGSLDKLSPARRDLEIELSRSGLSDDGINVTTLAFPFRGGDAGFAEALARLAKTNPRRALTQLGMLSGMTDRVSQDTMDKARQLIYREWLRKDPQAALKEVQDTDRAQSGVHQSQHLAMLMDEWAGLDPAAAAAVFPTLPKSGPDFQRKQLAESILREWYAQDAAAARNWAAGTNDPAERAALLSLTDELAASTPAAKTEVLLAAPQTDGFKLANAFSEWIISDPAAAVQKLNSIPAKDKFWQNDAADVAEWWAINTRGETTPEKFLETISTVPAGPQREVLLRGLADYGASNDIPFAQRMISEMTEGRDRDQAVSGLTELWMRKDPVKTSEWLTSLPPESDSRNSGVARFAEGLAPDDPERAAQWAATMPDKFWQKAGVVKTVMEKWRAKDPAAAEAWEQGHR